MKLDYRYIKPHIRTTMQFDLRQKMFEAYKTSDVVAVRLLRNQCKTAIFDFYMYQNLTMENT